MRAVCDVALLVCEDRSIHAFPTNETTVKNIPLCGAAVVPVLEREIDTNAHMCADCADVIVQAGEGGS